ncbi:MAG TPA: hypothetical protein VL651_05305 [Bacteroidia bacterium]|jgi:hypothetical protein|nr:hypothetical protein [Bacteroidia bacterium]
MLSIKKIMLIGIAFAFCERSTAQKDNTGTFIDGEVIPYNLIRFDLGLTYDHFKQYSMLNSMILKENKTGVGAGFETHLPLIYAVSHNRETRFRIADDIGLGAYMTSNTIRQTDDQTNADLGTPTAEPKMNGGIQIMAGIQAVYRISKTFDIGVVYYPLFLHYDFADVGAYCPTYGGSFRIGHLYGNFRYSSAKKGHKDWPVNKGVRTLSLRYAIRTPKSDNTKNFLFVTYTNLTFQNFIFPEGQPRAPQFQNYQLKNSNWTLIEVGWAMGF